MKNQLLSAVILTTASITTQAATPVDGLEYYIGASLGWHSLKDKNPSQVGNNYSIKPSYLSAPLSNTWGMAGDESGNGDSKVTTQSLTSLEDKRQMSFSAFAGARKFFDQGFFVGFEGQVSKTRKEFVVTTQLKAQYNDGTGKFKDATVSQYEVQTSAYDSTTGNLIGGRPAENTVAAIGTTEIAKGKTGTDSTSLNIKNSYTIAANVPVGMRFDIDNDMSVDVYGLLGYQYSKYKVSHHDVKDTTTSVFTQSNNNYTPEDFNYSGFTYGVGFDINVQEFKIGARYVINHLSTKDAYLKDTQLLSKDTKDNTFSVNLSYVF